MIMNDSYLKMCAWGGPIFCVLFLIGFIGFADFMPPISPADSAQQVAGEVRRRCGDVAGVNLTVWEKVSYGSRRDGVLIVARHAPAPVGELQPVGDGPVVVLDRIEKPGNVGAVFRTATAAGATGTTMRCSRLTRPSSSRSRSRRRRRRPPPRRSKGATRRRTTRRTLMTSSRGRARCAAAPPPRTRVRWVTRSRRMMRKGS